MRLPPFLSYGPRSRALRLLTAVAAAAAVVGVRAGAVSNSPPASGRKPAFTLEEVARTPMWGQFALSPDRRTAAYTLVSRYFSHPMIPRAGELSNIRLVNLASGHTTGVTSGTSPKTVPQFSPDGSRLSFEAEGDIWSVDLQSGHTIRLTTDQASDRDAAWSPDGRQIAFVSSRPGWHDARVRLPMRSAGSRIWVMSSEGDNESLFQVTREATQASELSWAPDGKRLLFVAQGPHYFSREIYVISGDGGMPTRLTPAGDSWNTLPRWSPDGSQIAFISDRNGFRSLWVMNGDGEDARQLIDLRQDQDYSHNDYVQTKQLFWSPDGTSILCFAIREGNLDLYVAHVREGRSERIGVPDGQYHPVGWLDDQTVAYMYEDYASPPDLYVRRIGGEPRRVTQSGRLTFRREHFGSERRVSLKSADGTPLSGYLLTPHALRPDEKLPGIVFLHTYSPGQNYHEWNPLFAYIVESGYIVLRLDQRGSSGYGRAFLESAVGTYTGAVGQDVVAGARFLSAHPNVDPRRLGVMGYSFGGFLVNDALVKHPDVFSAGMSIFGTVDRRGQKRKSWEYYLGGPEEQIPEKYAQASPVVYAANITAPVILIGGMNDTTVDTTQTYRYVHALRRAGKYFELFMYPEEQHGLADVEHQLDSYRQVMRFMDQFLQGSGKRTDVAVPPSIVRK